MFKMQLGQHINAKNILEKLKKQKSSDWIALLLIGVLFMVIIIPTDKNKVDEDEKNPVETNIIYENALEDYAKNMEAELEEALEKIQGVGQVKVLLTLKDEGEDIIDKNLSVEKEHKESASVIYEEEGQEAPYIVKRKRPLVEGVLVVCQGGNDSKLASDICEAIMALFNIEAHKIKVVKMKG